MLDFFSERFGIEYPWDKYAQVVVEQFIWGGMENTSATTLYERALHDERAMLDSSPDWLIAHELGHQWWGDLVTCRNWSHLWLNEGFATYSEILWAEHKLGDIERDWRLFEKSRSARSGTAQTRPIVDRTYPHPGSLFDVRAYPKGGWVLHMLRRRLGDDDFFTGLKRYGTVYAYQTAETTDLRRLFERLYGISLERFFYDWTERPGHPELKVETRWDSENSEVEIQIEQTQKGDVFHVPLKVVGYLVDRGSRKRLSPITEERLMTDRHLTLRLRSRGESVLGVSIDPDLSLLATIRETKPDQFWEWQLRNGVNVAEVVRAIEYFGEKDSARSRELLRDALLAPMDGAASHYGVRSEAAKALGKLKGELARDALLAGLSDEVPQVRRACADALGRFKRDEAVIAALQEKLQQRDDSYPTEAAVLSSLSEILPEPPFDLLVAALDKPSHREAIRIAALSQLGNCPQDRAFELLFEWTGRDRPDVCRSQAISSLAHFVSHNQRGDADSRRVVEHLVELLASEGPRHRSTIVSALGSLKSRARIAADRLREVAEGDPNDLTRDAAAAALIRIQSEETGSAELAKLRHDLEDERRRVRELQQRLEAIERADGKTP
jgi:aminopeptidase N